MTSSDSVLSPYYPLDFTVDPNGKKNAWECIVRIPFIDEQMLLDEASSINHKHELTISERERNIGGTIHRFVPEGKNSSEVTQVQSVGGQWGNALADDYKSTARAKGQSYGSSGGRQGVRNNASGGRSWSTKK